MDTNEYLARIDVITDELPLEFKRYVESVAYDRGHSAGYEEVLLMSTIRITEADKLPGYREWYEKNS